MNTAINELEKAAVKFDENGMVYHAKTMRAIADMLGKADQPREPQGDQQAQAKPTDPEDSTADTLVHIRRVNWLLIDCAREFMLRAQRHDESKLKEPEKSAFDRLKALSLSGMAYGADEYRACLRAEKPAVEHHYKANPHHPEFYNYGVDDMSLLDVLEMLCDWKAASERMKDGGSILASIKHNAVRFGLTPQMAHVLIRTAVALGWVDSAEADKLFWEIGGVPPKP